MKLDNVKYIKGWYLPEWDNHFEKFLIQKNNKWAYQQQQRDYALSFVKDFTKNAIDVGSNVGFWSKEMCEKFNHVFSFEPHPENIICYKQNLKKFQNYTLYDNAVSNVTDIELPLHISSSKCGNASLFNFHKEITKYNTIKVRVKRIDDFKFEDISFIKIDVQNHEKEVIEGSIETIQRCKPILCLELPNRNNTELEYRNNIIKYLKNYNYVCKGNFKKDTLFVYKDLI
jgi:FkbM family methyltransferase